MPTPQLVQTTKKDQSVETLRGIAIVLMVAGHVIGNVNTTGLRVNDDSIYRHFYFSLQYLRMPLFTFISGYVYAMRPVIPGKSFAFLKGKSRRILFPFVTIATVQYITRSFAPGVNESLDIKDIWRIYPFGFDQFWFLQAIFLCFITVTLIDSSRRMQRVSQFLFIILVIITASRLLPDYNLFSFDKYLYLLPYFVFGIALNRFADDLYKTKFIIIAAIIFIIGIICQQLTWFNILDINTNKMGLMALVIGLSGNYLFFRFRITIPFLAKLGFYSYSIFLFHVFAAAGSRIIASKSGIHNTEILFIISLTSGLVFPIICEIILLKSPILRRLFLGLR